MPSKYKQGIIFHALTRSNWYKIFSVIYLKPILYFLLKNIFQIIPNFHANFKEVSDETQDQ